MLIAKPQVNIVTRVVELSTGELARAYFAVIVCQGVQEVKFLGIKPLEASQEAGAAVSAAEPVALLSGSCSSCRGESEAPRFRAATSPFFSAIDFLVNQLARAPSRA